MKKSRYSEEQVTYALRLAESGTPVADVCRQLGIAEAAMVEASLPPSPTISLQRISGDVEIEIERRIVADILALATLPTRSEIAGDRFRQAQLPKTRPNRGLGLGLAIVKQLVELHGGSVAVDSAGAGHGATFTVTLPRLASLAETSGTGSADSNGALAAGSSS